MAQDLIDALDRLKIQGAKTKFMSFQQAVKITWKKDMLEGFVQRLSVYREELEIHLLVDLRFESLFFYIDLI